MLVRGFWENLEKPIIGLAPMDGVTDAAFRYMVNKYSAPSVTITEFTNVEGLARGAVKMLIAFLYNREVERPIVAQVYGVEVESYYKAVVMLCALGYDGVDINMGCPANKVAKRGSGAALIKTPELAKEIVRTCKKAARDWANGITMEEAGVHTDIIVAAREMRERMGVSERREEIPVSVKTRIGFDKVVAVEWMKHLMEELPANIAVHGRTLKQMYNGEADWDVIAEAAHVVKDGGVSYLGNGDVKSMADAYERVEKYGVDGVLVGRATFGNPWFFSDRGEVGLEERIAACLEHCKYLDEYVRDLAFHNVRKHMAWYCKGFEGAKEVRMAMMRAQDSTEVERIIREAGLG